MAIDAAILAAVERGEVPPTLRLFRWDPPCLSLGYSQPYSDINEKQLFSRGWDVVRRPTGGRAILHTDELTYSVIGPRTEPRLEGGLMESYRRLSRALSASIEILGLEVQVYTGKNPLAVNQPVCFENPSEFEITVDGKKIIGNAQARKKEGILQHGTLPLTGDLTRITEVLQYGTPGEKDQAARQLLKKAATVETLLGKKVSWDEAAQAFKTGFQEILNVKFIESDLTIKEEEQAAMLEKTQFGNNNWTQQI